ncbi:hypothetical protein NE865_14959 [Phthorimaea operculella]|nr:hypothetical protein NE865_14959 [Phthorimaea operculella]
MARHTLACVFVLIAVTSSSAGSNQGRWSRQISSYTSDLSDWVPLSGPRPSEPERQRLPQIKRQAVAEPRILAEPVFPGFQRPTGFSQDFGPGRTYFNSAANRQLYLQSVPAVPSAPQNYLTDQGFSQGVRFGLAQPNYNPLNQAFVGPQFTFDSVAQPKLRPQAPVISNPVAFPKSNSGHQTQVKPFVNQAVKKPEGLKYVDGYRVEHDGQLVKKPQSLQKLKYDSFESAKVPKTEMVPPKAKTEKEEVQLLYVPLESLNKGQFNFRSPLTSSQIFNTNSYNQNQRPAPAAAVQAPPKQTFAADFQRPVSQPIDNFNPEFYTSLNSYKEFDQVPKFSTISTPFPTSLPTTPKPKKLKPHQPPLAIFLTQEAKKGSQVKVGDVLSSLKNAQSVAVLDSVNPQTAPKVFIGPSNLTPPENFVKFELPYLSNIDHSDKKLRQLPFFVAPLSYNTPQGFAKIPFPSPHVGSVVINSQIKETTSHAPSPAADVIPNSYSTSSQQQEQKPINRGTQKPPSVSFYTTSAPKTNAPLTHKSNYYSFEPQTVSTVRPPKEPQPSYTKAPKEPGSYFLSNYQDQYNSAPQPDFDLRDNFRGNNKESVETFNVVKQTEPTTQRTTISSTTPKPSTYPSQLLETHNPYSINQAFHFSTPLDYHNLFDENYATPDSRFAQPSPPPQELQLPQEPQQSSPSGPTSTPSSTHKPIEPVTEKTYQQSSPNYVQNYSPEIHYESEVGNTRYQVTNNNEYATNQQSEPANYNQAQQQDNTQTVQTNPSVEYNTNYETQSSPIDNGDNGNYGQVQETDSSTKNRGRPRYTTPKADSNESTTRTVVTRRPLRERRPLPSRNRYEPNKITTERATRKPVDSNESTTKYSRGRTRGRVQFKPTEGDDYYGKSKNGNSKEQDLAYQRDVLHQNYPVTLMERSSTVDIEAITEPVPKISSTRFITEPATEVYDTENAYSYDRASVSQQVPHSASKEEVYTNRPETQTETYATRQPTANEDYAYQTTRQPSSREDYSYQTTRQPSSREDYSYQTTRQPTSREDYSYQSRSSHAPVEAYSQYDDSVEKEENIYTKKTTPSQPEATEAPVAVTEQSPASYSISDLSSKTQTEEATTSPEYESSKVASHETTPEEETEVNVIQTTPSYNRVRVRPGVIRQYHQPSSTESSKTKTRRPSQPVTYRPAFDRRRTTMRIEEIGEDLKTKPVHSRPDQDHRHPVYRPEATTESSVATASRSQDTTTVRGVFRRRRPTSYTTSSTEASTSTKRVYEANKTHRFRGRRPTTEKATTEKADIQTEPSTTTVRTYSRYTRPRLSERYNKKPEHEESDDQDSNYSINVPKYAEPENEQWSPKFSTDSFKPYNPNEISDDKKATTARADGELDIITAKNDDYDEILLTVTPASNNRNNKKVPDIPPTLEALVEQSKTSKTESGDGMSTFETMLEEVMKSLEEQDENEYTTNVQKHKGGEIGEIPPERVITSGDNYKTTTVEEREATTVQATIEESTHKADEKEQKGRRGFWKKVKVRPVTTESIEAAESQYYSNTVNRLGQAISHGHGKAHDKPSAHDKHKVTTYKPANYAILKDLFDTLEEDDDVMPTVDIPKIQKNKTDIEKDVEEKEENVTELLPTEPTLPKESPTQSSSSEIDLGTGAPDPTLDNLYNTQTEPTTTTVYRSDGFSIMDYLFGITSEDDEHSERYDEGTERLEKDDDLQASTEQSRPRVPTTETTYVPEEITAAPEDEKIIETTVPHFELKKIKHRNSTDEKVTTVDNSAQVETTSVSSFMDANSVVSTSMSTEISHETEICFRGKCIKTSKDIL